MNQLRAFWSRFRATFRKRQLEAAMKLLFRFFAPLRNKKDLDADMEEELRSHVEMQTQENIQAGMKPGEARREALREFGAVESLKEPAESNEVSPERRSWPVTFASPRGCCAKILGLRWSRF
jgi:hypothetical protein